ncbi:MAG: ATP-binding protein [Elusimicrobia bacterium]|nr:ATP-binding protein [Elusimicrobiota bacterium]
MAEIQKGKSPFYPGQPVPGELFVGRASQIERIMTRGVGQVAAGKPVAIFIQGEYGIGKSSIAGFVQWMAEREHGLLGLYAPLGGAATLDDVAAAILKATVQAGAYNPNISEKIRGFLGKYIGEQSFFGVRIHAEALKKDAPTLASPADLLPFFRETLGRTKDAGIKGIFLVLDEINGITANAQFAHFIKGLVDTNAMSKEPVPLLLMLCGVEDRRYEMIQKHQPIDRIFDVLQIEAMSQAEMEEFFSKAFESVQMKIDNEAMKFLTHYSAGFPKIMHLLGDAAYWIDKNGTVDTDDAQSAILISAEEVGKKYVDQQVFNALRSAEYRSILAKIAKMGPVNMNFIKNDVAKGLTEPEKKKFNNFLQKMKRLNVIRSGDIQGEYIFNIRMVRFYIWLQASKLESGKSGMETA